MKYWVYINGEVPGSFETGELVRIPGFSAASMICPAGEGSSERRWRRAGLFPDVVQALEERPARPPLPPEPPAPAAEEPGRGDGPFDPREILNSTGQRIFRHVTELMKELEGRRDEAALIQSLQRSLAETKNELQAARDRILSLEEKTSLIAGFQDRERQLQEQLERTRAELKDRAKTIEELQRDSEDGRRLLEEVRRELDKTRRQLSETEEDKKHLLRMSEDLNRQLAEREASLAQSLGLLRRLEQELGHLAPGGMLRAPRAAARTDAEPAQPAPPSPPALPPELPPPPAQKGPQPGKPPWRGAINKMTDLLKKEGKSQK